MTFVQSRHFKFFNFINTNNCVYGLALISNKNPNYLHFHKEPETYYLLYGSGYMHYDCKQFKIQAPYKIHIPSNIHHSHSY